MATDVLIRGQFDKNKRFGQQPKLGEKVSTYKKDYPSWPVTRREAIVRGSQWEHPTGVLESQTGYQREFLPHQVSPRAQRERTVWTKPTQPFTGESTMQMEYTPKPIERQAGIRPKGELQLSNGPFQSGTTFRDEFKTWSLPERFIHSNPTYRPPDVPMDTTTSYATEYLPQAYSKLPPIRPAQNHADLEPFQEATENRDKYKMYNSFDDAQQQSFKPNRQYTVPTEPFHSSTSYQNDFVPQNSPRTETFQPRREYNAPDQPFTQTTSYRDEFLPNGFELTPNYKPRSQYVLPTEPFSQSTSYQEEFNAANDGERAVSFKPQVRYSPPKEGFAQVTSYKAEYAGQNGERADNFSPRRVFEPPTSPMVQSTSYQGDFTPRKFEKTDSYRPKREFVPPQEPFENSTSYRGDFRSLEQAGKQESFKPRQMYVSPTVKFSNSTNYTGDFVYRPGDKAKPIRHAGEFPKPNYGNEVSTSYKTDFVSKPVERTDNFKPKNVFNPPLEPFHQTTSYQGDFLSMKIDRQNPIRHSQQIYSPNDPLESMTTNREAFTPKTREPVTVIKPVSTFTLDHDY